MKTSRLILVGGFLGAGKTTLLWEAALRLMAEGKRVGLVTNDQAPELVDTAILKQKDLKVTEVSGSCFCCNFNGLISALKEVRDQADADIIIAEPVGSCTDLSATILQPLKKNMHGELVVSPFTVMADPVRLNDILNGGNAGLHPSAAYIFRKQLEESDMILISKSDLLSSTELDQLKEKTKLYFPDSEIMAISSLDKSGMGEWLKEVLTRSDAGKRLIDVDYDVYAEGEALLGWLNGTISFSGKNTDWDNFAKDLMKEMCRNLELEQASVGHVKMMLESGKQYLTANLTGKADTLIFRGSAGSSDTSQLTLNARVEMRPEVLEIMMKQILEKQKGSLEMKILAWRCLSPGRPNPTFRFDYVVPALR